MSNTTIRGNWGYSKVEYAVAGDPNQRIAFNPSHIVSVGEAPDATTDIEKITGETVTVQAAYSRVLKDLSVAPRATDIDVRQLATISILGGITIQEATFDTLEELIHTAGDTLTDTAKRFVFTLQDLLPNDGVSKVKDSISPELVVAVYEHCAKT